MDLRKLAIRTPTQLLCAEGNRRLKKLTEKLNLTEDQQAKVKPILEDESKHMKALHDDTSLAPADERAKMKDLHDSSTEKINAVLTPDQQAKWKQMQQEMMEKHKELGINSKTSPSTKCPPKLVVL
jgi:Spy/CpxP family protein refolding chaperone